MLSLAEKISEGKETKRMTNQFTAEAKASWEAIPLWAREKLINNVWCPRCAGVTTITDFSGQIIEGDDLLLQGTCAKCGGQVARVIENE